MKGVWSAASSVIALTPGAYTKNSAAINAEIAKLDKDYLAAVKVRRELIGEIAVLQGQVRPIIASILNSKDFKGLGN